MTLHRYDPRTKTFTLVDRDEEARVGRPSMYPLKSMQVGDVLFFDEAHATQARNAIYQYQRRHDVFFSTRTQPDGSVRVERKR